MKEQELPKTYRGYSTEELLQMWEDIQTPQGIKEDTPEEKILAMRYLLKEYKIAPIHQV